MSDSISRTGVSAWLDNMGYTKLADAVMDEDRFPSADAVQIPIKLEKRYQKSRDEDITDAFMRGYLAGRSSADRPTGEWVSEDGTPSGASYSVYCSRCGQWSEYRGFFCLWCGAKMGGDTE